MMLDIGLFQLRPRRLAMNRTAMNRTWGSASLFLQCHVPVGSVPVIGLLVLLGLVGCDPNSAKKTASRARIPSEMRATAAEPTVAKTITKVEPAKSDLQPKDATAKVLASASKNSSDPVDPLAAQGFSVMTWNLEWFFDDADQDNFSSLAKEKMTPTRALWDWRRDAVAAAIAKAKPTILAVQEVENQRVLWYLTRALEREHQLEYDEYLVKGDDFFTEQDVGLLATEPAEVVFTARGHRVGKMDAARGYGSVSKHLLASVQVPVDDHVETVVIVNVHFRSKPEADGIRAKQAASVNEWLDRWLQRGTQASAEQVHLIVLGDFNTEQPAKAIRVGSELDVLLSRGNDDPSDDLIDTHGFIQDESNRRTHLLEGRQFDRILISRSLLENSPDQNDLVLSDVRVRSDLAIQGQRDEREEHWEAYWEMPDDERDLSDHYPVHATFVVE